MDTRIEDLYIGFDIGGTKCAVCFGTTEGNVLCREQFSVEKGFEKNWDKLREATQTLMREYRLASEDFRAVGISCGGPLDANRGIIQSPPNLPGWDNVPIVKMVEEELGLPAFLQNDANACGLAEWRYGAGEGTKNMVFLTMGTGLGGGLILNGQLYEGASGMAGEVGHIRMRDDGPLGFGKHGSLEGFCGGRGISEHAKILAASYSEQKSVEDYFRIIGEEGFSVRNLDIAQAQGNRFAKHVFEETGTMLGRGLAVLVDVLNPEMIVIGSIFQRSEVLLRPAMELALAAEALPEAVAACRIVPAALGDRIGDLAALTVAVSGRKTSRRAYCRRTNHPEITELLKNYPALDSCREDILKAFDKLKDIYENGGKLLVCGNGGSAADAGHIVGELMKDFTFKRKLDAVDRQTLMEMFPDGSGEYLADKLNPCLPTISLNGEQALNSAVANDTAADMIYAQQVYGHCHANDAVLGLSTSGNSSNVINAIRVAKQKGAATLGITGEKESKLSGLCDVCIRVPAKETYRVQELTLPIYHALCIMLESVFFKEKSKP